MIQTRMPSEPTRIRTTACWIRSELTTAPIELSLACSAIGPNLRLRAPRAMSPSSPGRRDLGRRPGDRAADALGTGVADGAGDGVGPAVGAEVGSADGPGDAPEAAGATEPDGAAVAAPLAPGLPLGAVVPVGGGGRQLAQVQAA